MKRSGFTLVELLAVILIMGIILIIAVYGINAIISRARIDNDVNLIRQVLKAGESFHSEVMSDRRMQIDYENFKPINEVASTANNQTNNFFNICNLPNLPSLDFHEGTNNFRRSLQRMNFNSNNISAVWSIDTSTLIEYGFLRSYLFEDNNQNNLDFSSCDPIPVVVLVSIDNNGQYTYTIAKDN